LNPRLHHLFALLETDRHQLLERLRLLSMEQLNYAVPGKWSIHQILAHLITAEKISVLYMNKKILGIAQIENTGTAEEIKMLILKISQRLPFRFKAPTVIVDKTPSYPDLKHLVEDWNFARIEMKDLLEKFEDHQLKKKIYRHVRIGLLNIQHALIFSREHFIHHRPQINRLLS
jgi:uncharacterized damage-inducible protein DinB